jgi:hypothetical protein
VEAAFKTLKSELGLRLIYHQLENRAEAHILVAFLGYVLWGTLKCLLKGKGSNLSPARTLSLLVTLRTADIVLPTTDGGQIRLRRVATLSSDQQRILNQLGITIPEHLKLNFEWSADSVIARGHSKGLNSAFDLIVTNFG